jgi:CRISPR-associated protein Cas2
MRSRYLVSYDVCHPRRLRRVHKKMKGYGEPLQYSVFLCDLSEQEKILMIADVTDIIKADEDQVMIVNLGPPEGRGKECIEFLGAQRPPEEDGAVVL